MGCFCGGSKKIVTENAYVYKSTPNYKTTTVYKATKGPQYQNLGKSQNQESSNKEKN
ncbi:hypothetical protein [Bacillus salipaludis]|uniref:Uncharacterized protein n=1 Tax=Bacillus salipaludis TaxID=2547811 RepID=A0AA90TWG3_9BACI|nr:hypothetical protein [Bacillus salipaludis]MDQ6600734.1 hypothetical protein [Bacillus salipaludis]